MRIRVNIGLLVLMGVTSTGVCAEQGKRGFIEGNELVAWMRESEAVVERRPDPDFLTAGLYTGYILGMYDSLKAQGGLCRDENATVGQIRSVVTKFLKDHPEKWSSPATLLVLDALAHSFPCIQPTP